MKKITTLGLGVALITGAVAIPFTSASNGSYQEFLNKRSTEELQYRTYSPSVSYPKEGNSINTIDSSVVPVSLTSVEEAYSSDQPIRNYRGSRSNTEVAPKAVESVERTFNERVGTLSRSTNEAVSPQKAVHTTESVITYPEYFTKLINNGAHSFQIPSNFLAVNDEETSFVDKNGDATFTIELLGNCSNDITSCGVSASRSRNYKQGITVEGIVLRENTQEDTELGVIGQDNSVLAESFKARLYGKSIFVSRNYVTDSENNVYLLEFKTSYQNLGTYVLEIKSIFDSFRIVK